LNPTFSEELFQFAAFLVFALGIGEVLLRMHRWRSRSTTRDPAAPAAISTRAPLVIDATPDEPVAFGYKIDWLSIRSADLEHVVRVLEMQATQPANWESGLDAAYRGQHIFVSPPVEGWVFVVHQPFRDPGLSDAHAVWEDWMRKIAGKFSEVHFFTSNRDQQCYAWARFVHGRALCKYRRLGRETIVNLGERPAAVCEAAAVHAMHIQLPDEEDVLRVAAEWGFNPMTLEDRDYPRGVGLVGRLPL